LIWFVPFQWRISKIIRHGARAPVMKKNARGTLGVGVRSILSA